MEIFDGQSGHLLPDVEAVDRQCAEEGERWDELRGLGLNDEEVAAMMQGIQPVKEYGSAILKAS